jgi:Carboxypeptidase regulatory-like domain/TonB dependent receptor
MSKIRTSSITKFAIWSFFLTGAAFGQGTSSLRGTVSDTSHGAVEGAAVTLTQSSTGVVRSVMTQKNGEYQFAQMPPGNYSLSVSATGFAVYQVQELHLQVDTPITDNIELQVASTTATVNVTSEVEQINTTNATLGNGFQEQQVQMLPLQTRNVVELLSIQPGVTQTGEVMGARRDQNNITLDGVDSNDNQNALSGLNGTTQNQGFNSAIPVPLDSVMEFRVTVAGLDSTQGRSSGGQVSLVTKSGTNAMHGSAYEYNRNTAFTANNWFNNRDGLGRPQLVRNQFGATLGGPVKKDRIFYFLNYERRIDSSAVAEERSVPSDTFKQGIIKVGLADGSVATLTPSQVAQIDPLGIGSNPTVLKTLQQYPSGNDPAFGADGGLNFSGYRFNAPSKLDNRIYVGRFDWILDQQGRNTISFRGTLSNQQQTLIPAQFPGQSDAQAVFSDNRGFSTRYTSTITPSLVNIVTVGLSRIGYSQSGAAGTAFTIGDIDSMTDYSARAFLRVSPTWNAADDLTWVKGSHSISAGFNFRNIDNNPTSYANAWPSYRFSRGILRGLGADIVGDVSSYLGGATVANKSAVTNAFGDALGLVDSLDVTYNYGRTGAALPVGSATAYDFVTRNYEGYVQDVWKARKNLTITFGLRYQYDTPPYEASGLQVGSSPGIDQYFAAREAAQAAGVPGNQLPNGDRITFNLNGPANGTGSWYKQDRNNFAPRISIAYAPTSTTSIRAGAGIAYDQYGNDLVANAASLGAAGLSTQLGFPTSYDFSNSPRLSGGLPGLPAAPAGGFPFTLPDVSAIAGTLYGINPNLVAPYSYLLNFTVSHQFKSNYSLDVSYIGRLSHSLLAQEDAFSPLIYFKDKKSGMTWVQADTQMRALYNNGNGVTPNAVQSNSSLVPTNAFVEDMFPALANYYIPGSASANYFYGIYGINGGSDLDNLHALDRAGAPNGCLTVTGCYTFFAPQGSSDPTWTNAAKAAYHGLAVSFRHTLSHGLAFDLNYTWSHSFDNVSSPSDNSGQFGGDIQNAFMPNQSRASSDFDIRHQFNADILYRLPFGNGQRFLGSAHGWINQVVGGWQLSSLIRLQSGLPTIIQGDEVFPTNYWESSIAVANGAAPKTGVYSDENGSPNLFSSVSALNSYQDEWPGQSGTRAIVRLPGLKNVDLSVSKDFHLPWEGHVLQFRAEAYNAFNFVNFNYGASNTSSTNQYSTTTINNLSLTSPSTFGEFTSTTEPRVLQLSLHYNF